MNAKAQNELYSIKTEFNSIIRELESIRDGIKRDFVGIGNDVCASRLTDVLNSHYKARKSLNSVDISKVTEQYAAAQGGRF